MTDPDNEPVQTPEFDLTEHAVTLCPCPFCAELIQPAAKLCRYCKSNLETPADIVADHDKHLALLQRASAVVAAKQRGISADYESMRKDQMLGALLTLFLGPIGLLYCGPITAIVFIIFSFFTAGLALFVLWPLSFILSFLYVTNHNDELKRSLGQ